MRNTVYIQYNMFEFKIGRLSLLVSSLKSTKAIGLIYSRHLCYTSYSHQKVYLCLILKSVSK